MLLIIISLFFFLQRAKDRAAQEEWLQALLDSMALPIVPKNLKTPGIHCLRYSMDNLPMSEQMKEAENTLPKLRNRMGGIAYGGSLDAATWSRKCRPVRSPSPNIPKGKMLERILGYVEEVDDSSASDTHSINDRSEFKTENQNLIENSLSDGEQKEFKKIQDENRNDFYSTVDKSKKKIRRALSDNELIKPEPLLKKEKKEESRFERIKNVIRRPREKNNKKCESVAKPVVKKRRQSFLQKVFKRHHKKRENDIQDDESDFDDPLYDTIDNVQEQKENLINKDENEINGEEGDEKINQPLYSEVQKPIFGSKSILTAQAMSELKNKLKSRESLEGQEIEIIKDKPEEVESELFEAYQKIKRKGQEIAPALPPRRGSRPRSPWHDIPSNNSLVNESNPNFNITQAQVKFHDELPILIHRVNDEMDKDAEEEEKNSINQLEKKNKDDDLSILLEQLADITTAPLMIPDNKPKHSCSLDSEIFMTKPRVERRFSDPDYDIPRPHRLLNICASVEIDKISATQFLGRSGDTSESSSSFPSMEPDSLEAADKGDCST